MPKPYTCVKKLCLLTFGSINYASKAGGYAAVTKGLMLRLFRLRLPSETEKCYGHTGGAAPGYRKQIS